MAIRVLTATEASLVETLRGLDKRRLHTLTKLAEDSRTGRRVHLKRTECQRLQEVLALQGTAVVTWNGTKASIFTREGYATRCENGKRRWSKEARNGATPSP